MIPIARMLLLFLLILNRFIVNNYICFPKTPLIYELFSRWSPSGLQIIGENQHKISVVPSPRNHAVYKTNLTNRHEKNSDVFDKVNDLKLTSKLFLKIFNYFKKYTKKLMQKRYAHKIYETCQVTFKHNTYPFRNIHIFYSTYILRGNLPALRIPIFRRSLTSTRLKKLIEYRLIREIQLIDNLLDRTF